MAVLAAAAAVSVAASAVASVNGKAPLARVAACAPPSHAASTLVFGVDYFSNDFDPASSYVLSQAVVWHGIYENLVTLASGSATKLVPALATSWKSDKTKKTWTFQLRHGVKFTDGSAFDAAAVKANYARVLSLNLGTQSILGAYVSDPQQQIVVQGPYTVQFRLKKPVPSFPLVLASEWGMGIVSPAVFTEHSTGDKDQGHAWLQTHADGTGPYMIESLSPGDTVTLVKNPDYWGGWSGQHFTRVIIRTIPESATRRQLLQSGDLDIAYPGGTAQDTVALRADACLNVVSKKNLEMQYIILGDYGPLADPRARQALNYAFPYSAYAHDLMKDIVTMPHGVLPDLLVGHDSKVFTYPTNLKKAQQLLTAAGVKKGTTLTYEYYTGYGDLPGLALQSQLKKIGINLKLVQKDYSVFNTDLTTNRPVSQRANMYFWGWYPDYNSASDYSYPIFSSASTPAKCPCYNSGYYKNATVDKIISQGFFEQNPTKLKAMWKQAQDIMSRVDPPIVPVAQQNETMWLRTDVNGYQPHPVYILTPDFYGMTRG
jgi:peptide/nickel transport system substrate-binding protein